MQSVSEIRENIKKNKKQMLELRLLLSASQGENGKKMFELKRVHGLLARKVAAAYSSSSKTLKNKDSNAVAKKVK